MENALLKRFLRKTDLKKTRLSAISAFLSDAKKDATSERCIPTSFFCKGRIVAKSDFAVCGIVEADAIFKKRNVRAEWKRKEGQSAKKGEILCILKGQAQDVLACERTALNFLSLLSGISTKCSRASEKYGKWKIAATRKTLPDLAHSEKRAVALGGCLTHRLDLSDGIMVKDNHIAAIMKGKRVARTTAIEMAVRSFPRGSFVEVEVSSVSEALAAIRAGADAILVDNTAPKEFAKIAKGARKLNGKIIIEASGRITLENAGEYLKRGADFVSTSELTMDVAPADLSLES